LTSNSLPWDEIATPKSDYNVRLAAPGMAIPVFWGKDAAGQPLAIVELAGDHTGEFSREPVILRGIAVDLRAGERSGVQRLVLALQQRADADLFGSLCETLIAALLPVTDPAVGIAVALAHLRRWKAFLAGRRGGILTPEEVRGLIGELLMLRDLHERILGHREAVDAWTGADRVQHDFVFRGRAVEVKALSGKERNAVRISSEDQLEVASGRLFLVVRKLAENPEAPEARSLNALVHDIETELPDADALEEFQRRLAAAGYLPLPDYDTPRYVPAGVATYEVAEGFPRLVRSEIPHGIARVSYDLELEAIAPFACVHDTIFEGSDGSVS
jgi:hypothetical protein